jgi:hypothetical protein
MLVELSAGDSLSRSDPAQWGAFIDADQYIIMKFAKNKT